MNDAPWTGGGESGQAHQELPSGTGHVRNPRSRSLISAAYRIETDGYRDRLAHEALGSGPMDPNAMRTATQLANARNQSEAWAKGSDRS